MKTFVNATLFSVALLTLSNNAFGAELVNEQTLHQEIATTLAEQRTALNTLNLQDQVEQSLSRSLLYSHTDMLIAQVKQQLPEHRFKVVFAD
ncbi:hypothetical protein [Aestuariibacter salexigens]|uniref:hypothetical protein n=1 Tax=Aestuariibacter salexigens TaxID=226010 RepID=UPI000425D9A5|nr:hypothetical protein [Aestuariibacter salexigens]